LGELSKQIIFGLLLEIQQTHDGCVMVQVIVGKSGCVCGWTSQKWNAYKTKLLF